MSPLSPVTILLKAHIPPTFSGFGFRDTLFEAGVTSVTTRARALETIAALNLGNVSGWTRARATCCAGAAVQGAIGHAAGILDKKRMCCNFGGDGW